MSGNIVTGTSLNEEFLVVEAGDLAGELGVSLSTLRRMEARGEGPRRIKVGARRSLYTRGAINTWMRDQLNG